VFANADERLADLVVSEQFERAAGVLGRDQIHLSQNPKRPKTQILQIPDRRRDDVEHGSLPGEAMRGASGWRRRAGGVFHSL